MFLSFSTFTEKPWLKQLNIARTLIRKHVHTMAWYSWIATDKSRPDLSLFNPTHISCLKHCGQRSVLQSENRGVYLSFSHWKTDLMRLVKSLLFIIYPVYIMSIDKDRFFIYLQEMKGLINAILCLKNKTKVQVRTSSTVRMTCLWLKVKGKNTNIQHFVPLCVQVHSYAVR